MAERYIEYTHNGDLLEAYMAWDETSTDTRPGVLISHAWAGRSEFEESKAEQLADLGYVGFALDLYGKGVKGSNPEQNSALMQPLLDDRVTLQRRMHLALGNIRKQKEVDAERIAVGVDERGPTVFSSVQAPAFEDLARQDRPRHLFE